MDLIKRASQRIAERLTWCTALRDQAGIAKDLAEGKDISEVYGLGEAGLFDEFFYFLDQFGIMDLFLDLDPRHIQRSSNVTFPAVILIYVMRIVAGLAFFWHIHPVILRSQTLMRIVGFNGTQIRNGTSERGKKKSCPSPDPNKNSENTPDNIRGPLCPDSIASYIQAISAHALERLFNRTISISERTSMMTTRLILVGGFLGAGKTTLLWEAAQRLSRNGQRVGLITNDQAPELVDTAFLSRGDVKVKVAEVNGSCFCCNFQGLLDAMSKVRAEADADVLIAEPVGSCTDLSATIVQPLKDRMSRELAISPLSVMADPVRLADILDGGTAGLHPSAAYIFRKQLEEADIVVVSKTDLMTPSDLAVLKARLTQACPTADVFTLSVKTGEGVDAWLDAVTTRSDAGRHLAEVNYDVYAEGEAVLGWLNATVMLRGEPTDWKSYAERLLEGLSQRFDNMVATVGHVKLMAEAGDKFVFGNLTGKSDTLSIRGSALTASEARLTLNARVQMSPEALEAIVQDLLVSTSEEQITVTPVAWHCLSPGRPNPTHRYDHVVAAKWA